MKITNEKIDEFKNYLIKEEKTENTIKKYVRDIKVFCESFQNFEITKEEILSYKQKLCEKYKVSTVNSIIASINAYCSFANENNLKVKTVKTQKKVYLEKEKELTKKEYERLLKFAYEKNNKKIFYIMKTICQTGIRISELKFITVEALKNGQATINLKGKLRVILLPDSLITELKNYASAQGITKGEIFITRNGNSVNRANVYHEMQALCKRARVNKNKVFPHNFRHLFARTFYNSEKDIVHLADILGHSSINTTRIYTLETIESHKKQINKIANLL